MTEDDIKHRKISRLLVAGALTVIAALSFESGLRDRKKAVDTLHVNSKTKTAQMTGATP